MVGLHAAIRPVRFHYTHFLAGTVLFPVLMRSAFASAFAPAFSLRFVHKHRYTGHFRRRYRYKRGYALPACVSFSPRTRLRPAPPSVGIRCRRLVWAFCACKSCLAVLWNIGDAYRILLRKQARTLRRKCRLAFVLLLWNSHSAAVSPCCVPPTLTRHLHTMRLRFTVTLASRSEHLPPLGVSFSPARNKHHSRCPHCVGFAVSACSMLLRILSDSRSGISFYHRPSSTLRFDACRCFFHRNSLRSSPVHFAHAHRIAWNSAFIYVSGLRAHLFKFFAFSTNPSTPMERTTDSALHRQVTAPYLRDLSHLRFYFPFSRAPSAASTLRHLIRLLCHSCVFSLPVYSHCGEHLRSDIAALACLHSPQMRRRVGIFIFDSISVLSCLLLWGLKSCHCHIHFVPLSFAIQTSCCRLSNKHVSGCVHMGTLHFTRAFRPCTYLWELYERCVVPTHFTSQELTFSPRLATIFSPPFLGASSGTPGSHRCIFFFHAIWGCLTHLANSSPTISLPSTVQNKFYCCRAPQITELSTRHFSAFCTACLVTAHSKTLEATAGSNAWAVTPACDRRRLGVLTVRCTSRPPCQACIIRGRDTSCRTTNVWEHGW